MDNNNDFQPVFNPGTMASEPVGSGLDQVPPRSAGLQPLEGNQLIPKDALETQKHRSVLWIILTIIFALTAVTFIGLFIWMYAKWNNAETNVQGQIDSAVAVAVSNAVSESEKTFEEREKYPHKMFSGPSDLGSLTFEYPKTWSLYEASDGSNASGYTAYLNPDKVPPVSNQNPVALRVMILNEAFDSYIRTYSSEVERGELTVNVMAVGGSNASVYSGLLDNQFQGIAAIFKIRDKTVVIQTDALVFEEDFYQVLSTVKYNS